MTPHFDLPIVVQPEAIDELGHVNNIMYLRWVQDAAVAHWTAEANPEDLASLFWVVLRHEIDYKRPAFAGDEIIARTWVGQARHLRFERHTEIFRASDKQVLAKALTIWCPIDRVSGKPAVVSEALRARFSS